MVLPSDLISEFVEITNDKTEIKTETTVYGTIVANGSSKYVKLDGSDLLTPISSTTAVEDGERVTVMIKDHSAVVTGNLSSPSARTATVDAIEGRVTEAEGLIAGKVSTETLEAEVARISALEAEDASIRGRLTANEASITNLNADNVTINGTLGAHSAVINNLDSTYATIENLEATNGTIHNLEADYGNFVAITTNNFEATNGTIRNLEAENVTINGTLEAHSAVINNLDSTYATIENLEATNGTIRNLEAGNATINGTLEAHSAVINNLDSTYANIDFSNIGQATMEYFYAHSGLIQNVVVDNGTITGNLVGVTIKGDLIEGGTVVADKLVIQGEDGLYYKLNVDALGEITASSDEKYQNGLDGSVIIAQSITATQISVSDLVAFDATIGGFNISENSIYSGAKTTVGNTASGIYMDKNGQIAFGDASNYVKFYKDTDGNYKLDISAQTIKIGSNGSNIEEVIEDAINEVEVGGRNVLIRSDASKYLSEWSAWNNGTIELQTGGYLKVIPGANAKSSGTFPPKLSTLESGEEYTVSFYAYADTDLCLNYNCIVTDDGNTVVYNYINITTTEDRYSFTFTTSESYSNCSIMIGYANSDVVTTAFYIKNLKVEKGNKATDWTPAPEDIFREINEVESVSNDNSNRLNGAESSIVKMNGLISLMVDGLNNASVMTQTEDGWKFDMSGIIKDIKNNGKNIGDIQASLTGIGGDIEHMGDRITEVAEYRSYIDFTTTTDGRPCILLGKEDSPFKVNITNTNIEFKEGSDIPAYISNNALNINNAVINNELSQGEFSWIARANGNYGLLWKGV